MKTKNIHFVSGLSLTLFIGLHLLNHLISIFGIAYHINFMNSFRVVYRNPVIESVLLLAVIIQVMSGIKLVFQKRKAVNTLWAKLQIWTGFYLAFFLVFHVSAVFMGRLVFDLDTNFYFGVAGLNSLPANLFFVPYYGFALFSFFGHIASIHNQKMKKNLLGLSVNTQSKFILWMGILISILIFYGLTNGLKGIM